VDQIIQGRRPLPRKTGTTDLAEAKRLLKIRQGRIAEGHTPVKRIDRITYDEAANDLRLQYEATKTRNVEEAAFRFKNLDRFFRGTRLTRVAQQVPAYTTKRRSEGAADKTLNNEFEVLIKMLRLAYENNKLMRLPVIHKLKVNNVRQGFFEEEQFNEVCSLLRPDYQVAALNATTYGWRMQSEVLMLAWPMVDFAAGTLRPGPGMTKMTTGALST
jgi:hypothetical protein